MTRLRRLTKSLLFVCLAAFPLAAQAATMDLRVLFDVDQNTATGCTVDGMKGVDQVLVTRVIDDGTTANVTQTHRQVCAGGVLGGPIDVNTSGWPVGFQTSSGHMLVETAVPFTAFGSNDMPAPMRIGFAGTRGTDSFSVLTRPNGDPVIFPAGPAGRRHSVAHPGPARVIVLDGKDPDWAGIPPSAVGAGGGASNIKLIQALTFANPNDFTLYFNFGINIAGIEAVDDYYERTQGDPTFTEPAPGVLGNDISNGVPLTAVPVGTPDHGTVTLNPDGSFTYEPNDPDSLETDSFEYKATHNSDESNVATVTIAVAVVEQAPAFTSANHVELQAGVPANFLVTTDGIPPPAINYSGTLPTGVTFTDNGNGTATIGGTPANGSGGTYVLTLTAINSAGTANQTFTITVCNNITVTNPATNTGTAGTAFSQTFTQSGAVGTPTFTLNSGSLPAGLTLASNGVLSGTPTQTGSFPITVRVTDSNGCIGVGATYTLTIGCQTITVTNPATTTGTAATPFSQTFTQAGAIGGATFTTSSTLPAGLTLAANGTLSGTPTQTGSFPIVVTVTDGNGCTGTGATYTLLIGCQTITVTNPATTTGTQGAPFSQTFTQSNAIGAVTFTTASTLPTGLTLAANGTLSGVPTQGGSFPIVVTVTDANGCSGSGPTYNLLICPTITVTNPVNANGTASSPFSETFTQTGAIGGATFTLNSGTLPAGLSLATNGVLSGTPTQTGSFPITVLVTDGNGCTAVSATYNLTIGCQVITVNNPANGNGTASSPFSETFTQTGGIGGATFTLNSGTLPAGLSLAANGVLSGTPTQTGSFPITVTATDANGCTGTSGTYTIVIACQVINVINPANVNGTASSPFSETFTQTGAIGTATFTLNSGTLPAGLTLAANGVLSGTPTQVGSFPITVLVTDSNGCTGVSATYNLTIACQVINVINPANANGTASSPFSETFTQTGAIGGTTFTLNSGALPTGLTLAANGVLSGTPTQTGSFPITVLVTDSNGCTGVSGTYTIVIACQVISVINPANANGTASSPFSETFTQTGAIGGTTFTLNSGTLPAGLSLAANGVLSGTPTQTGSFPITVLVTDSNGCTGVSGTYTIVIACQVINVINPANANGTASSPFSETFTQTGAIGGTTFTLASGTLPAGLTLAANGVLSGTPTQTGSFPITVTVTDSNGCTGTSGTYTIVIACQVITVTNPANANGTASSPFSETFTQTGAIGTATFTLNSGTLPAGLTLAANGVLSGIPTQVGSFPITVLVTDSNGCTGVSATYNLTIGCQVITVTNPVNTAGTVSAPFSETFTQTGAIGTATFTTASTLPAGLTLATNGVLSGTPTQNGSFPIVVTVTDSNGCTGTGPIYTLVIGCQTITVTNPANANGTVSAAFSETFTQTGAVGGATFTTASTLPVGLSLSTAGVLSGIPTQSGVFPIVVTVTDGNGCTGTSATYNLTIACQVITVTNPANATGPAGSPFSETFTQTGAIGTATFTTASTLPTGLSLSTAGVLSGTPTQGGSFPIVVTVTDSNGCTGTGATYNLTITCPIITVTNPGVTTGTAGSPFSQTFTQSGGQLPVSFTTSSTLPTGLSLSTAGVLSGTPTQTGSFPIVVTVTDTNGCTGTGTTYTLVIGCQTITVNNPGVSTGVAAAPFSQTFTQTSAIGGATFTLNSGTLPAGLSLATNGTLSGTPTQTGSFPITVKVTDGNGCTGVSATYNLTITCQTITVTNPATNTGTVNAPFSQTFTQVGAIGTATFTTSSTLPTGFTLSAAGVLSGTTLQHTTFPIVVTVTDSNGCTGTSATYNLTINCQTITVTNPVNTNGTVGSPFSETFTESGSISGATFTTASTLPAGLTLSTGGVLSGTPTQAGSFPIVVTVTDGNGCTGTGATYNLVVACNVITVSNPGVSAGTVDAAFSQTFTQTGANGTATFTLNSGSLPSGLTLSTAGVLSGTPGQPGSFPITVLVTDSNGCTGVSPTYTLVIACQTITVNNPGVTTGTVDAAFSQSFTQTGVGTHTPATFTINSGSLPSGLSLSTAGVLSGTPGQPGSFPITVKVTDVNGCTGISATYTLVIACQTITVNNPATTTATYNQAFSQSFTQTGVGTHTPANFTTSSTLPTGLTLSTAGVLSGTPTQTGTFPITVTVTDVNGCTGTSAVYSLAVRPVASPDTINGGVDNTQLVLTGGTTVTPGTPTVQIAGTIKVNDLPSAATVSVVPGTFATTAVGATAPGSVTIAADGTFLYTPPLNSGGAAITSDTFQYQVTSDTGSTGTPATSAPGTVTINLSGRVWYVKNNGGAGNGRSQTPFNTLANAQTASTANDYIFVYFGDGSATNQNAGFTMKAGQKLYGEGVSLIVNGSTLVSAGSRAVISNAGAAVTAQNISGVEIKGLSISATGGSGRAVFARTTGASSGSAEVAFNTITAAALQGINVDAGGSGSFVASVHDNTVTATGNAIEIVRTAGTVTITAFDDNIVTGNSAASGIVITGLASFDSDTGTAGLQTVLGGTTTVGASGNGVTTAGIVMNPVAGDLHFADLSIYADNGAGLSVTGSGGMQVRVNTGGGNTGTIVAIGGPAVDITSAALDLRLVSMSSTNSATTGVSLATVTGTFSAATGSTISNATGTDFNISAGTVDVTYNGTISDTTGRAVSIASATGGTKSFTGAISNSGATATGISLTNNTGATMNFSGLLTLSTAANAAFAATGAGPAATSGGTVTASNTANTIVTTTGTALNVTNTTIGTAGLRFTSINAGTAATGPANGILLNNTGSSTGGLIVSGTGALTSGGLIQRSTGDGVSLTDTRNVSLSFMDIDNNATGGVDGLRVNTITMASCRLRGNTNALVQAGLRLIDISGTSSVSSTTVSGSVENNVSVTNNTTTGTITMSNCTVQNNSAASGNIGMLFATATTGNLTATVNNAILNGNRTIAIRGDAADTSNLTLNIAGATITAGTGGNPQGNQGVEVASSATAVVNTDIQNVNVSGLSNTGINVFGGNSSNITAIVKNNTVVNTFVSAGASNGFGIRVFQSLNGTISARVESNNVSEVSTDYGILGEASGGTGTLKISMINNTSNIRPGALDSIRLQARNSNTVCAKFSGNIVTASGTGFGLAARQADTSIFRLEGLALGSQNGATTETYLEGQNPGTAASFIYTLVTTNFTGVAANSCGYP